MRLNNVGELALLREIRERFRKRAEGLITGIGDDAAVIAPSKERLLLTSDMMVEGVHFDLSYTTPFQLGYRVVSVNVSDIYAMAGIPEYLILDLAMGRDTDTGFVDSFLKGIKSALRRYNVVLVGGDLSSSKGGIVVAATIIGRAKKPILRSGARPGDRVYVTGSLGDSACGLEILRRLKMTIPFEDREMLIKRIADIKDRLNEMGLKWEIARPLIKRHLMNGPRGLTSSFKINKVATAMMDISDGLFIDLVRLCDESKAGAKIYLNRIPLSSYLIRACSVMGLDPYRLATTGGEDYELLFTAPDGMGVEAFCIGEITRRERIFVDVSGIERPLKPEGYQHWQ